MFSRTLALGVALVIAVSATGRAQEKPASQDTPVPIKLQLVLSRYQGEKKIASMPYTLWMSAGGVASRSNPVYHRVRMGVDVPVASTRVEEGKAPVTTWDYRNVGAQLEAQARAIEGGRFSVLLSVSHTALYLDQEPPSGQKLGAAVRVSDKPMLMSFSSNLTILLRDGETGQYISATDPVSGEVLKVDATLTVLK